MAKAGLFRERVEFQRLSSGSVDAYGNTYTGWATLTTRFGDIRERTGKERITSGVLLDRSSATLRVRSDSTTSTITNADRVIARGITWAILSVIQVDSKNTMIEFLIEEGVAA